MVILAPIALERRFVALGVAVPRLGFVGGVSVEEKSFARQLFLSIQHVETHAQRLEVASGKQHIRLVEHDVSKRARDGTERASSPRAVAKPQ